MRVYLVAPVPLGALLVGWAVGWSLGVVVILLAGLALGFGCAFWVAWDVWQFRRRERQHLRPGSDTGLR
jgi:hypothetical protein